MLSRLYFALSSIVFTFLFHIKTNPFVTSNSSRNQDSAAGVRSFFSGMLALDVSVQPRSGPETSVYNYLCTLHNSPEERRFPSRVFGNSCDKNECQTFSRHAISLFLTKLIKSILNVLM